MEIETGIPLFRAVITKINVTTAEVTLHVRHLRKNIFYRKRKEFEVNVPFSRDPERYLTAKAFLPGDEFYVDSYGEEWSTPIYHNAIHRKWNLIFA